MNQRYRDVERASRQDRPGMRRQRPRNRGPHPGYGRAGDWPDEVWSGRAGFDEGEIGQGPYGSASQQYAEGAYGRRAYGQDQYGWIEYDEPRYVGSLYRGERLGEEPYREHKWPRSEERPRLIARLYARGPKGYTRSDERIADDISEQLWRAEHIDSSEVAVAVENGMVKLSGTVPERWMRHGIEDVADSCMGVKDIENNVRVLAQETEEAEVEPVTGARTRPRSARSATAKGAATVTRRRRRASRK